MSFYQTFLKSQQPNIGSADTLEDIKYHLTKLFEAEASLLPLDHRLEHINRSNYRFGIEDIQLLSASLDSTQLGAKIAKWISKFEPRLNNITVEILPRKEGSNSLNFSIFAKLHTDYGEKELVFDSKIALNDLNSTVEEDSYE